MKQLMNVLIVGILLSVFISGCGSLVDSKGFGRTSQISSHVQQPMEVTANRQDLPELTESSGLSEYLAYAALNNPGLEAEFNRWKAALERVPQVTSLPDPRFSYRYFIQEVETRVGAQRQALELAQMFPWFGKLDLRGDVALQGAHAQQQRYEAVKLKLFYEVKDAYYEYYYLAKAVAVAGENVELIKHLESVARIRFKAAVASHPDVIRAQVELGKLEDRLRTLIDLRDPMVARLNAALNRPVKAELPWPGDFEPESVSFTDELLLEWLTENNPELKALDFEINRQKKNIELAQKNYYPDITVGLNYIDTADSTGGMNPSDDGKDPVGAMVSVNIPLWRGKYAASVREARQRYYAAGFDKEEKSNSLSAALKMVLYRFRDAERKIDLYQNALLPLARESLKVSEASYRAGEGSFIDLIDAQRILLEFELAYERAQTDREQSLAKVEMLVGRDISQLGNEDEHLNVMEKERNEK